MDAGHSTTGTAAAALPGPRDEASTRLSGTWLGVARALWVVMLTVALGAYIALLPGRFGSLHSLVSVGEQAVLQLGLSANFYAWYHILFEVAFALGCTLVGILIFWRRSDDWVAMFMSFALVMYGARIGGFPIDAPRVVYPEARWLVDSLQALGVAFSLLGFYLFPDGRFTPSWTKPLAVIWVAWAISWAVLPNSPINMLRWNEQPSTLSYLYLAQSGWYGSGALALLIRYRRVATPTQRQQAKWVVSGLVFVVLAYVALNLPYAVFEPLKGPGMVRLVYGLIHKPLLVLALLVMPACFAIAMLRYRLWDIDIVVSRTLVYGALTLMLAAIYFPSMLLLQQIFQVLVGHRSPLAVIAATLGVAILFNPLRTRLNHFVDSRFFPERHDAAETLGLMGTALREEVDINRLTDQLETVIWNTLRPAHVLSWLRTPTGFGVSLAPANQASDVQTQVAQLNAEIDADNPLVELLQRASGVVELDRLEMDSETLQRLRATDVRLLVPLVSQGELAGWLTLGPRLSEQGYSLDDYQLLNMLATQAAPAVQVAQLVRERETEALERERLEQELRVARFIQQTLLPQEPPALPGWRVAGHYQPARAVGGDFYDYLPLADGRMGFVIGDVTDKGVPAALIMATTRSILRSAAHQSGSPGEVLRLVNELLVPEMPPKMFATCLYAVLDPATGRLRYANAGHNPPCHWTREGVTELWATGMPLGLMPGMQYEENETTLAPGDSLLLYSDGLVEAHNAYREMFGSPRLHALLSQHAGAPDLIERLLADLADFSGIGREQEDDVTLVTIEREGGDMA